MSNNIHAKHSNSFIIELMYPINYKLKQKVSDHMVGVLMKQTWDTMNDKIRYAVVDEIAK